MSRLSSLRAYILFSLFVIAAGAIGTRLFLLQVVRGDYYAALAQARNVPASGQEIPRGDIYFQDPQQGQQSVAGIQGENPSPYFHAAFNQDDPLIYASPKEITNLDAAVSSLAPLIGMPAGDLQTKLNNSGVSYVPLVHQASQDMATRVKDAAIPGIHVSTESVRTYPAGNLAANVLGFLGYKGNDHTGQYGLEQYYNGILTGADQALGATQGADLELTIDYNIQYMVQKKLEDVVAKYHAKGGSAIIMDPKTGAILAMASAPSFDPNNYASVTDPSAFMNRGVQSIYEPGSIMKALTMASAVDAGAVTPDTTYVDPGAIHVDGYTIQNFDNKAHGTKTMDEVLQLSLNTGAVFAEQKLGDDKFRNYLKAFQLDQPTAIDLSGEVVGNLSSLFNNPHEVNFMTAAFGQGVAVSDIGFLKAFASLGNHGTMMKPYVVKSIHYPDGTTREISPQSAGQPISLQTAATLTAMLVDVVSKGYDHHGGVPGYDVAGKTGTAQIACTNGRGYCGEFFHSFAGYAPAQDPVFAGLITMDSPQGIAFASSSLAPVFGDIASYILQYYHAPAP